MGRWAPADRPDTPDLAPDRQPWERQPRETDLAWARFRAYRDTCAPRCGSFAKWCAENDVHRPSGAQMFKKWRWVERIEAWDRHLDAQGACPGIIQATRENAYELTLRQTQHLRTIEQIVANELAKTLRESQDRDEPIVGTKTLLEMLQYWSKASTALAGAVGHGEDTSADAVDLTRLTVADLKAWKSLTEKAKKDPEDA